MSTELIHVAPIDTYTPVNRSVCSTHGAANSVKERTEITTFVRAAHNKIDSCVPKNLGHYYIETEKCLETKYNEYNASSKHICTFDVRKQQVCRQSTLKVDEMVSRI
jgi:hypothetical protein